MKIYFFLLVIFISRVNTVVTCDSEQTALLKFLSKKATALVPNQSVALSLRCFKDIHAQLIEEEDFYKILLNFHKKKNWKCLEMMTFSTGKHHSVQVLFLEGQKTIKFDKKVMSIHEQNYIKKHGIKIFKSCDDFKNLPKNLSLLFRAFFGGFTTHKLPIVGPKVSKFMEKAVQETVEIYTERPLIKRQKAINFKIDKKQIQSGDVIMLWRMDGINTIIEIGSGSRTGHCTVALWRNDELYICESKSSSYFPVNGVQCTEFHQWMQYCKDSDINLVLLPLKDEYRKKFDVKKAWQFVDSKYDNEYGYHNFFFGWIDTPDQNLPDIFDLDYLTILLHLFEKFLPNVPKKYFLDAFSKRLNSENLNIDEIWEEIYKQNTTLQELAAIPEQESWLYDGQTNYTCSSFATAVLEHGGAFGDIKINATEFTPKDLYELDFWELNKNINGCEQYMEDGLCQFLGHYKLQLGKVSFVKPYEFMDEKCPTIEPDYNRTEVFQSNQNLMTCQDDGPGYFKMFSKVALELRVGQQSIMQGRCFLFNFEFSENESDFVLNMSLNQKQHFTCFEFLIFSTGKTSISQTYFLGGQKTLKLSKQKMSVNEQAYVHKNGLKILRSCDKSSNLFTDLFKTLKMFIGGMGLNPKLPIIGSKIWDYQLNANIEMIKQYTGFQWQKRKNYKKRLNYPKNTVKSGDIIMIARFDGIDNIIHLGSGSKMGHSTIALWRDDKLYICESQSALYFPRENIQCNEWDQWMQWADNADYNVIIIPLKKELAQKFDSKSAWRYVDNLLDTPYGFHNFLFGWIDTKDQNLPDVIDLHFVSYLVSILQKFIPQVLDTFLFQALSKRLKKEVKNVEEVWDELYIKNMDLSELMAIPEQDEWTYKNGKSLVCSSFMAGVLRAGGLFNNLKINVTEMTPKDVVDINFWDNTKQNIPEICKDSISGDYCQLMGKIKFDIGKSSFLEPYEHMSEHCPTLAPDFNRVKGC